MVMETKYLEIFSVVGCDMDYETDDGDICIYRIDFRMYSVKVEVKEEGIYEFESDWGEVYKGTLEELLELQLDGEEVFSIDDVQEEYVYDEALHQEPPIEDDYDTKWGSEEFFISKDEASKYCRDLANNAKTIRCSGGMYEGMLTYYSDPR